MRETITSLVHTSLMLSATSGFVIVILGIRWVDLTPLSWNYLSWARVWNRRNSKPNKIYTKKPKKCKNEQYPTATTQRNRNFEANAHVFHIHPSMSLKCERLLETKGLLHLILFVLFTFMCLYRLNKQDALCSSVSSERCRLTVYLCFQYLC